MSDGVKLSQISLDLIPRCKKPQLLASTLVDRRKQHSMTEPKKLLNSTDKAVTESLEGLVASCPNLQLLDGLPDVSNLFDKACICKRTYFSPAATSCLQIKVVLRSGAKSANQVTVIAGKALLNFRQAFTVRRVLRRCPVFRWWGRP